MFLHFADSSIYNKEARGPSDALQNGLLGLVGLGWTNKEYLKKNVVRVNLLSEAECNKDRVGNILFQFHGMGLYCEKCFNCK